MPQPLARLNSVVRVTHRLLLHSHFHFADFDPAHCVVRNVEVGVERGQLLKKRLVDDGSLLVSEGEVELPILLPAEVLHVPNHMSLR